MNTAAPRVYDNSNRGALFKNKKKEDGDKRPNYTGPINVAGVDYWISAWLETSKAGEKFMSLSVTPQQPKTTPTAAKPLMSEDDMLEDWR